MKQKPTDIQKAIMTKLPMSKTKALLLATLYPLVFILAMAIFIGIGYMAQSHPITFTVITASILLVYVTFHIARNIYKEDQRRFIQQSKEENL